MPVENADTTWIAAAAAAVSAVFAAVIAGVVKLVKVLKMSNRVEEDAYCGPERRSRSGYDKVATAIHDLREDVRKDFRSLEALMRAEVRRVDDLRRENEGILFKHTSELSERVARLEGSRSEGRT